MHGFSYHCYADNTQLFLSFPSSDSLIATRISDCLADISTWMSAHHLKLNLNKTELLFLPGKDCPHMDLLVTVEDAVVGPSPTARNLGVILDDQLRCTANITAVTRSCRFALYNIRRIRPFLTRESCTGAHPERGSTTRVQPAEVLPCDPSLPRPPLAPCSSCQRNRPDPHRSTSQTPRPG